MAAPRPAATRFRADVEGLRAVAVVAVVLFHAGVPAAAGGFVGVDAFFVISGFLITGLLYRQIGAGGSFPAAAFYGARARRLLPAAVLVLVATVAVCAAVLPPLQARGVVGDAVAAALYAVNYRLALQGTDYLASGSPPSPLQHYWSLGVEEQFYLLWPLVLVLAVAVGRRRGRPRAGAVVALSVLAAASFATSLAWTASSPPWAYFALPSRAWELAIGGLVALGADRLARLPGAAAAGAGWIGLGFLAAAVVVLDGSTPFPGTAALLPVAGTALVVAAGFVAPRYGPGVLLGLSPLRAVGRLSYSWYLWHWPVLLLAPAVLGHPLGLPARLAAAGVSAVLALATLRLVEDPVRFAGGLRRSGGRSLALGGALSAAAVAAALVAGLALPVPVGHGGTVAAPRLRVPATATGDPATGDPATGDPATGRLDALVGQVRAAVEASADVQELPADLHPPLAGVAADRPEPFRDGCLLGYQGTTQPPCLFGDPRAASTVALVGDSHAAAWQPALEPLAEQRHWRLDVLAKTTCPLLDLPIRSPYLHRAYTECDTWRAAVLDRLRAEHPRLVVLAMARRYGSDFGFTSYDPAWLAALTGTVQRLRATGAAVLVLGPVADPHSWVPTCLSSHLSDVVGCAPARAEGVDAAGVAAEAGATRAAGGRYADLTDLFCSPQRCPVVVGADLVFRDDNHLTVEYATYLAPVLAAEVALTLPGG